MSESAPKKRPRPLWLAGLIGAVGGTRAAIRLENQYDLGYWEKPFPPFLDEKNWDPLPDYYDAPAEIAGTVAGVALALSLSLFFRARRKNKEGREKAAAKAEEVT